MAVTAWLGNKSQGSLKIDGFSKPSNAHYVTESLVAWLYSNIFRCKYKRSGCWIPLSSFRLRVLVLFMLSHCYGLFKMVNRIVKKKNKKKNAIDSDHWLIKYRLNRSSSKVKREHLDCPLVVGCTPIVIKWVGHTKNLSQINISLCFC